MTAAPARQPPEPYRQLLCDLGADKWRARQAASRQLELVCLISGDLRWLFWARRYRDPEIRLRSNNVLRKVSCCPECGGFGFCTTLLPREDNQEMCRRCNRVKWWHDIDDAPACTECGGAGSLWKQRRFRLTDPSSTNDNDSRARSRQRLQQRRPRRRSAAITASWACSGGASSVHPANTTGPGGDRRNGSLPAGRGASPVDPAERGAVRRRAWSRCRQPAFRDRARQGRRSRSIRSCPAELASAGDAGSRHGEAEIKPPEARCPGRPGSTSTSSGKPR